MRALRPVVKRSDKTERRIELITGGVLDFWTLEDEDAGRSRKYKRVIVDEAGLVKDLETRWNDAIRPTLADLQGDGWLFGTPKGRNFFYAAFCLGQDELNDEWASWQMPTSTNPYIDASEIEAARLGMPQRSFEQEFLAMFLEDAGGVFRGVREAIDPGRATAAEIAGPIVIGVDLARVEDFTVICGLDQTHSQVYFERFNQIGWQRQVEAIVRVANSFPNSKVLIDSTGVGDPIFEMLRKAGIRVEGYHFTNQSKEALIDNLALGIESGKTRLMDIPQQTSELQAYEYEVTAARNVRMNAPPGMHDDCVIALALAQWQLTNRKKQAAILFAST